MKRKVVDVLLITLVFTACVVKVAPISGQNKKNEEKIEENVLSNSNKRGILSVIENALEEQQGLNKVERTEITKNTNVVGGGAVKKKKIQQEGWTTANLNVRESPSTDANILDTLPFNTYIKYYEHNNEWAEIAYDDGQAYVSLDYIGDEECEFVMFNVPKTEGFKSFTQYKTKGSDKENIFNKNSRQYALQCMAYTGTYGIRQYNNRFCVAIGTAFGASVGAYVDLILENATVIPCIVSDIKADNHTQENNMVTAHNGCVSEFIVDKYLLPYEVWNTDLTGSGDISDCYKQWNSPVASVIVYDKNIL